MAIRDYHLIWLEYHPNRTMEWLQERLEDGFDVHHMDGDHGNNDWRNLALVEASDHMRLHGYGLIRLLGDAKDKVKQERLTVGRVAYDMKSASVSWSEVGAALYSEAVRPEATARAAAKDYAIAYGEQFPKPDSAAPSGPLGRRRGKTYKSV